MTKLYHSFLLACFILPFSAAAQAPFYIRSDYPVSESGIPLQDPWVGGMNSCQFSDIDLNFDGVKDLMVFDRSGDVVSTFINNGANGAVDYHYAPEYRADFPEMSQWVLLADYNCDGKEDIFTYRSGGMSIYRNTGDATNGLSWELMVPVLTSIQGANQPNLFVSSVDIPAICDLDNDGDLDVLTFGVWGSYIEYHRNYSVENGYGCDSLQFEMRNQCWGYFSESPSDNSVTLNDTCVPNVNDPELTDQIFLSENGSRAHTGSSLLALDMNNDGDKELVMGDISFNNLVMITNGGTPSHAYATAQDPAFPPTSTATDIDIFPAPFHVDVDNDGKRDLLASPNTPNLSNNFESVWFYKNTGTDLAPVFNLISTDFIQADMIDHGDGAYPVFFDYNGDGLEDLFVSNYGYFNPNGSPIGKIALYENTGSANAPAFELIDDDFEDLSTIGLSFALYPAFADLDGDGDKDMMVGDLDGLLHYFENIASAGSPADFVLAQPLFEDFLGDSIDVGANATPHFVDLDRDGDQDLIIGERNGNINWYDNIGTPTAPSFRLILDSLGGVDVSQYFTTIGSGVPIVFEENGEYQLLIGSQSGYLHHYGNIEADLYGTFTLVDSTYYNIYEGPQSAPAMVDINGDSLLDLVTGNIRGGLIFLEGSSVSSIEPTQLSSGFFKVYPNPSRGTFILETAPNITGQIQIRMFDAVGKLVYEEGMNAGIQTLQVEHLQRGIYLLQVAQNGFSFTKRIMIEH